MTSYDPLQGSLQDFRALPGKHLLERLQPFAQWQGVRRDAGVWPFGRSTENGPHSTCQVRSDAGNLFKGINLASQDYLGLSSHPGIRAAAIDAMERFGVHSAGSPALVGNTSLSLALEQQLGDFLQQPYVTLFPTGWAAGFGVIKALVRQGDHVVIDQFAHACLNEGAHAATANVRLFRHNDLSSLRKQLHAIRSRDSEHGILVVTESLFSMDSDTPDLAAIQALADESGAILLVDAAHDLGSVGANGWGHIGDQGMRGKIDLVMGSFSKTFASNGGFVACCQHSVKEYLRYYSSPHTFSNALSPVQAAVVSACLSIVASAEGERLRAQLHANICLLRQRLVALGLDVYGEASPIVCVKMGTERLARLVAEVLPVHGLIANLVEYPAVGKGVARFRLQVMASHQAADLESAADHLRNACVSAGMC